MTPTSPMRIALATIALLGTTTSATSRADESAPPVAHRTVSVDGLSIFYREAGPPDAPAVLLLHGFPSSFPPASRYSYTLEQLARTMDRFTEVIGARLDAGHFALETHAGDIAAAILEFLARAQLR